MALAIPKFATYFKLQPNIINVLKIQIDKLIRLLLCGKVSRLTQLP